jgi:hypothetical protein
MGYTFFNPFYSFPYPSLTRQSGRGWAIERNEKLGGPSRKVLSLITPVGARALVRAIGALPFLPQKGALAKRAPIGAIGALFAKAPLTRVMTPIAPLG